MKPRKKKAPVLRLTDKEDKEDRVSFTCPDCYTVHTFKLLSPYECLSLSDEDRYKIEYSNSGLPVLFPLFVCTEDRCNFEAELSLDTKS